MTESISSDPFEKDSLPCMASDFKIKTTGKSITMRCTGDLQLNIETLRAFYSNRISTPNVTDIIVTLIEEHVTELENDMSTKARLQSAREIASAQIGGGNR